MRDAPTAIVTSSFSLEPDGLVELFVLTLPSGPIFRMTNQQEVFWQGFLYESIPCSVSSFQIEADGRANRPNFTFANPQGVFTSAVGQALLDNAALQRYRILRSDLIANNNIALLETLRISQVLSVTRGLIVTQLRDVHDAQPFVLPGRAYYPPEFPHVKF